jgi:hypothetical protein
VTQDLVPFRRAIGKDSNAKGIGSKDSAEGGGSTWGMVDGERTPIGEQISKVALSLKDQGKEGQV